MIRYMLLVGSILTIFNCSNPSIVSPETASCERLSTLVVELSEDRASETHSPISSMYDIVELSHTNVLLGCRSEVVWANGRIGRGSFLCRSRQ